MRSLAELLGADALDFSPAILRLQREPPSPLPRVVLYALGALLGSVAVWSVIGRLDIIAVAPGRLVPVSYVKVVQPVDAGIIKEILVREGDAVKAGQVMVRMDPQVSNADSRQLLAQRRAAGLALRRIDAELAGVEPKQEPDDLHELFAQMLAQYRARRQAHLDAVGAEQAVLAKAQQDLRAALETESKLQQTLPIYQDQERSWRQLQKEGFAGRLLAEDRKRVRIEVEQELKAQGHAIAGLRASIQQSRKRIAELESNYRQLLYNERVDATAQYEKTEQDWQKQAIRQEALELKAPQDGIVKDLATHTEGAVLSPGTVLLTIVPADEPLRAEVWVGNEDRGFVREGQTVRLKIHPYPFQKYGMLEGLVKRVSADASEQQEREVKDAAAAGYRFRSIVELKSQVLESDGVRHALTPGMQVDAEIALGERSVLEYILSPVRKAFHEAARER
jgi:HlyD family secretion protein